MAIGYGDTVSSHQHPIQIKITGVPGTLSMLLKELIIDTAERG
jgi:hypothetical protein